jgi:hypothetical protein
MEILTVPLDIFAIRYTTGKKRRDENQIKCESFMDIVSACCWKMLLDTIIITRVGTITKREIISPCDAPNIEMNSPVVSVVLVTIHKLVPVRVVAKNHSGASRSFKASRAEREPPLTLGIIRFLSEETKAISPPE